MARKVKSYIKDTNDFLRKIASLPPLPDDIILCTIDVVGLYSNIPHDEGLIALRKSLESWEDKTISTDSLMDLAEYVLKNNIFEHNLSFFKQIRGTAIGTKMAPPYAIIFMGSYKILQDCNFKPLVWWRYIDDIFLLWQHGEEKLKEFLDILNHYHPSIKFTSKYSREWIDFLDVEIIKEGNRLLIDVFVKSTDTHQYHSKKSILYSQALRFNRICSKNQFFDKRCNDLEVWLKNRGYNEKLVRQQILKARKYKITELLHSQREEVHKNKLVFNITYYPIFSKLKNILSKIHLLTPDREHNKVFEDIPIIGFKKGKSLKDMLVRAKVPPLKTKEGFCGPCNKPRCEICKHITKTHHFE